MTRPEMLMTDFPFIHTSISPVDFVRSVCGYGAQRKKIWRNIQCGEVRTIIRSDPIQFSSNGNAHPTSEGDGGRQGTSSNREPIILIGRRHRRDGKQLALIAGGHRKVDI